MFYLKDKYKKRIVSFSLLSAILHLSVISLYLIFFTDVNKTDLISLWKNTQDQISQESLPDPVDIMLSQMTLEKKIGQMLMGSFAGIDGDEGFELIEDQNIGGLILFRDNLTSYNQAIKLTSRLQAYSYDLQNPGLILATDHEGGKVAHLSPGIIKRGPAASIFGKHNDLDGLRKQARHVAHTFRDIGINMNLAPVVDVRTNPQNIVIGSRSYGNDPNLVSLFGSAYIRELQTIGIIATAKHFPGHGSTAEDSHLELPVAYNFNDEQHLAPFRKAIDAGVNAIMTAHVLYPEKDDKPATLSRILLHDNLRDKLGFDGVIISDDMRMGSIENNYSLHDALIGAINAGNDILLISGGPEIISESYELILDAVASGDLDLATIDNSAKRILTLKERYGLVPEILPPETEIHISLVDITPNVFLQNTYSGI